MKSRLKLKAAALAALAVPLIVISSSYSIAATFTAQAGPGFSNTIGGCTGANTDTSHCQDGQGEVDGHASASAGHVGASASAASFGGQTAQMGTDATAREDIIFNLEPNAIISPVGAALNLHVSGSFIQNVSPFDRTGGGAVALEVSIAGVQVAKLFEQFDNHGGFVCVADTIGGACGNSVDKTFTTAFVNIPLNLPVEVIIALHVSAGASDAGASSNGEFQHSLDFITGSNLFTFDREGVTANDVDGFVVNNRFVAATPLPAAFPLFATGLAGMGWLARRRRKQAP